MKGPDPVKSVICSKASVAATEAGIMNGTLDEIFPIDSSTRPNGLASSNVNVLSSTAVMLPIAVMRACPIPSLLPQRASEATQSAAVTGSPLCHVKPSRKVNDQFMPSSDLVYVSTI